MTYFSERNTNLRISSSLLHYMSDKKTFFCWRPNSYAKEIFSDTFLLSPKYLTPEQLMRFQNIIMFFLLII
jgi:hypothetical protein